MSLSYCPVKPPELAQGRVKVDDQMSGTTGRAGPQV